MQSSICIIALSAAFLSQAAVGLSAEASEPVRIDNCRILNTRSYVSAYKPIEISFTNQRASTADEIRFVVQYGGRTEHITDKGRFVQNVRVVHAFNGFFNSPYFGAVPGSCKVEYVHFSDGGAWTLAPAHSQGTSTP